MGRPFNLVVFFTLICTIQILQGKAMKFADAKPSTPKVEASMMLFFNIEQLQVGNKIPFLFRRLERAPNFISKEKADSIPFTMKKFEELLRFFSIPPKSVAAEAMKTTLVNCEGPAMQGETKFCPTSTESMFKFARGAFSGLGGNGGLEVLGTTQFKGPSINSDTTKQDHAQNYTIFSFKEYVAPRAVGCHAVIYPYAVYYCHYLEGGNKVFMTHLEGDEDGERLEAPVLCHMDTSTWGSDHNAFPVLGTKPGTPVCHIFPYYDLVFIPDRGNDVAK